MVDEPVTDTTQTTEPTPTTSSTTPTPDDAAKQSGTKTAEKLFTQTELNSHIDDRLKRERAKYADHAELKKAAAELQELKDAEKTELERLQEQLSTTTAEMETLRETNTRNERRAAVARIAGQLGAADPYDANLMVATQAIDPNSDGADEQIKESIEAVKAAKPYLFGRTMPHLETFNPGKTPPGSGVGETDEQRRTRIHGSGGSVWDPSNVQERGGGVVMPKADLADGLNQSGD